jgi:MFS family permease
MGLSAADLSAQAESEARTNANWNFGVNVLDLVFFTLANSLIARDTVMPVLVSTLTDSKLAVGLIPAIFSLGLYLPQLFVAKYVERLTYKMPFLALIGGLGERAPYLLIALSIWFWAEPAPTATLVILLILLGIAGLSGGALTPAWLDLIAKVIPVQRRGLFTGLGHGLGAFVGVLGAVVVGKVLADFAFPDNFALLFGLASAMFFISWVGLVLNREPPSLHTKEPSPFRAYLRRLPAVLQRNHNYRAYLLSRMAVLLGGMATGFFMVYGRERFAIDAAGIGTLTALLIGSQAVMNLIWGILGDHKGHKIVLTGGAFALMLAILAARMAPTADWFAVTFVLLGAYIAGDAVSSWNILIEFCAPEDRPTYVGMTNTLLAPVVILAPILGGWLAASVGYIALLTTAMVLALFGALLFAFWVREPRHAPAPLPIADH